MGDESSRKKAGLIALAVVAIAICFGAGFMLMRADSPPVAPVAPNTPEAATTASPAAVVRAEAGIQKTVYQSDFTAEAGSEWNVRTVSRTAQGDRPQLGPFFPPDSPALTVKDLPPHKLLRMTFDLYLTKSWDGSSPGWGPSLFELALSDERKLIYASFTNCGFFTDNNEQSFPDNYPAIPYQGFTLAAERQSLGGTQDFGGGPGRIFDCSSVYHMVFTFPHAEPLAAFNFKTDIKGWQGPQKGYAIANLRVETLPELKQFSEPEFAKLWADLGSGLPETSFKARWELIAAGDAAVEYIGKHAEEPLELKEEEKKALAADMAGPDPEKAMAAFYQLRVQGPTILPLIQPLITPQSDPFMRLAPSQFERYPSSATQSRLERAKWVLEAIHSPNAIALKRAMSRLGA